LPWIVFNGTTGPDINKRTCGTTADTHLPGGVFKLTCITLSPGLQVQPNRYTCTGPGGFSVSCRAMLRLRAPRLPRFIGHSTWI
jgi:hypothetical protein